MVGVTAAMTWDIRVSRHRFEGDAQASNKLRHAAQDCWTERRYTIRQILTTSMMHGCMMLQSGISLTPVSAKKMSRHKAREQDVMNPSPHFFNVGLCGQGAAFQDWTFFLQLVPLSLWPSTLKSWGAGLPVFARLFCLPDIICADTGLAKLRLRVRLLVSRDISSATFFSYRVVQHLARWLAWPDPSC